MKKKIIAFLMGLFIVAVSVVLGGCFEATPTKESVTEGIKERWDVELPENITLINYSLSVGMHDYLNLYIFEYKDCEEAFTNQLSSERNEKIEKFFINICESRQGRFNEDYTLPDIPEEYFSLYKEELDGELIVRKLYILYMPEENQLLVYNYKL